MTCFWFSLEVLEISKISVISWPLVDQQLATCWMTVGLLSADSEPFLSDEMCLVCGLLLHVNKTDKLKTVSITLLLIGLTVACQPTAYQQCIGDALFQND